MINQILQHKMILGLVFVVILGGVWYGLSSSSSPAPLLETSSPDGADQQLVADLLALRAVNLSGTIFQDPVFQSLQDFSTQIQSEPTGRQDPFAPLVQSGSSNFAATSKAQIFSAPEK